MAVLVTGGAGYIGSHTCVELLEKGYDVIVVDNFSNSKREALERVMELTGKTLTIYHLDLLEREKLKNVFIENNIEAVIHFAGLKAVGESALIPLKYYHNNITGTIHLCETMRKFGVKKLIFSSSATVYGNVEKVPIDENAPLQAINPYGRTKLFVEEMLKDLSNAEQDWKIIVLRYFNPIGAHESGRIGEDPSGIPNNLVPYISQVAIGKINQLYIFGSDYPTKDGTGIRDYIHVVDVAKAHRKALEKINSIERIDAFNLGTGIGYSVLDIVKAFEKASGKTIPYTFTKRRQGDAAVCYANPKKAHDILEWKATKDLASMCEDTWRWQTKNPFGYQKVLEPTKK